jgi:asparagine synthase (glutamine-hydrolysing)
MCGIKGPLCPSDSDLSLTRGVAAQMTAALAHRGSDVEGIWTDGSVALGQRRLSILDLSEAGAQPMHSACGGFVIVFNGEIYNHLDLRLDFEKTGFAVN